VSTRRILCLAVWLVLGVTSAAFSQAVTAGTGAINGRVSDNSQAVMPGVTVTISSPSMMGVRTGVTDGEGQYRFTAVPPGEYTILFELPGFTTVRNEGIRISTGFTGTVNAELKVATLEESVVVTGQSPVVDTSATQIGNTFDAKQLSALPTSRDYFSLLAGSPAVQMNRIDVGGSTNGTQQGFVTYGTTGQVRASIEGINATEATGAFGNYPDVGAMDEVQINTAALSAEASTPGVQSQFISKSGGRTSTSGLAGTWVRRSCGGTAAPTAPSSTTRGGRTTSSRSISACATTGTARSGPTRRIPPGASTPRRSSSPPMTA